MLHLLRTLSVRTIVWLAVLVAVPALLPGTAAAQDSAAAPGLNPRLLADASWHGRQIQRPLARRSEIPDREPSLGLGTGFTRPGGSRRVRDLQRRLAALGYRPGTRDGLFGPRTQAAVLAFQRKHGLRRTGSVGSDVLRVLRTRTTPGATAAPLVQQSEPLPAPLTPTPTPPASAPITPVSDSEGLPLLSILLLTLAVPLLMFAGLAVRGRAFPALEGPRSRAPRELEPPPTPVFESMPAHAPSSSSRTRAGAVTAADRPTREGDPPPPAHAGPHPLRPAEGATRGPAYADRGDARRRHDTAGDRRPAHGRGRGDARRQTPVAAVERACGHAPAQPERPPDHPEPAGGAVTTGPAGGVQPDFRTRLAAWSPTARCEPAVVPKSGRQRRGLSLPSARSRSSRSRVEMLGRVDQPAQARGDAPGPFEPRVVARAVDDLLPADWDRACGRPPELGGMVLAAPEREPRRLELVSSTSAGRSVTRALRG